MKKKTALSKKINMQSRIIPNPPTMELTVQANRLTCTVSANWTRAKRMQFGHESRSAANLMETQHQKQYSCVCSLQIGILMTTRKCYLMQGFMVFVGFFQNPFHLNWSMLSFWQSTKNCVSETVHDLPFHPHNLNPVFNFFILLCWIALLNLQIPILYTSTVQLLQQP